MLLLARALLFSLLCLSQNLWGQESAGVSERPSAKEFASNWQFVVNSLSEYEGGVKGFLAQKVKGSPAEPIFNKFPNLYSFIEKLVNSDEAIPSLYGISGDKQRLFYFALCILGTFIFGFILKRMQSSGDSINVFAGLFKWFFRLIFIMALRLGIFYFFFHKELSPSIEIFKETML